jgi:hypothetical protein
MGHHCPSPTTTGESLLMKMTSRTHQAGPNAATRPKSYPSGIHAFDLKDEFRQFAARSVSPAINIDWQISPGAAVKRDHCGYQKYRHDFP